MSPYALTVTSPIEHEAAIRLSVFAGMLVVMVAWESLRPTRKRRVSRAWRWSGNLGIMALSTALLRVALPMSAVAAGHHAQENQLGLLQQIVMPELLRIGVAVLLLDLMIYWQHRVFHKLPMLWRLHKVHHADRDFDATTALRFHPIEILMSMGIKIGAVYALGAPAVAVLAFEVLLNGAALFNHANASLPCRLDSVIRLFVVTPDMHRVHHSTRDSETNSNYGFNLSCWDRLFRTYVPEAAAKEESTIGLEEFQRDRQGLVWMLLLPFKKSGD